MDGISSSHSWGLQLRQMQGWCHVSSRFLPDLANACMLSSAHLLALYQVESVLHAQLLSFVLSKICYCLLSMPYPGSESLLQRG